MASVDFNTISCFCRENAILTICYVVNTMVVMKEREGDKTTKISQIALEVNREQITSKCISIMIIIILIIYPY